MRFVPKWLQGILLPTLFLWICVVGFSAISTLGQGETSFRADIASRLTLPFLLAWWVVADARKRGRKLCYDFDSFVFFAGPFVVPVYLFQTRGLSAFLTLLWFGGMLISGGILGATILILRDFM